MSIENPTKICTGCLLEKPFEKFIPWKYSKDNYSYRCKDCVNAYTRKRYQNNIKIRVKTLERIRAYRKTEKGKEVHKKSIKKYLSSEKGKLFRQKTDQNRRIFEKHKLAARKAVAQAVKNGHIPPISIMKCEKCNLKAVHYHHTDGYNFNNWYDIIPLCMNCHIKIHS
jgi:hypothetical protein